jgi:hypothetical protein
MCRSPDAVEVVFVDEQLGDPDLQSVKELVFIETSDVIVELDWDAIFSTLKETS